MISTSIIIVTVIIILLILLLLIFIQYNEIIKLNLKVQQSKSTVDIYCQQRFDLIPNLVEIVKAYQKHEEEIFKDLSKLRAKYTKTKDLNIGQKLDDRLSHVITVLENYPELKASSQFLNLQKNSQKMESQLQAARRIYNNDVTKYNIKISVIPYNIVAKLFGFKHQSLFQLDNENIRNDIEIN